MRRTLFLKRFLPVAVVIPITAFTLFLLGDQTSGSSVLPPVLNFTKSAALVAGNGDADADPGDTIEYTVTLQNTAAPGAGNDATGVQITDTLQGIQTLVAGSINTSPIAFNDTFAVTGNIRIQVPDGGSDVLANDIDPDTGNNAGLTASGGLTSTQGGNVSISPNGSFTYNPPAGFEGTDTYTYTVTDAAGATGTGTITFNVSGMVWFINNNAGACPTAPCNGRLTSPFQTLAAFQAVNNGSGNNPAAGDSIFIDESATPYSGGISLLASQKLIGQDATASLSAITGITLPPFSDPFPAMNTGGNSVTIQNAGGSGVTVNNNGTALVRGMTLSNSSLFALSASNFGTLTVADVIVNTNGGGISLNNGTTTASFSSFTSTGGTSSVSLTSIAGTVSLGSGAMSGATGTAFLISGGTAAVTYTGTISKTAAGQIVNIGSHASGNITLSGNLTCNASCTGINATGNTSGTIDFGGATKTVNTGANPAVTLATNTGATINFSGGGLDIDTTSGAGFSATGGGTVSVTTGANPNTIDSGSGTALNVQNTIISASGITFRSISHNGNNTAINLNNTGSGAFTVTGNGGTCTTTAASCTGGAIENIVGADAITLNSTGGLVTLSHMLIDNISASTDATDPVGITRSGVDGISGLNVNGGLTLDDTTIRRISDNAILGGTNGVPDVATTWNGLSIINGSLIELTNRFHVANRGDANNEGTVRILGVTGTVTVTDSVFQDGAEFLDLFPITGTLTLNVTNNNFHRGYKEFTSGTTASVGGHCIDVTVQNTANAVVNIGHRTNNALDNDFLNCRLGSIRVANDAGATGNIDVMIGQNEFTSNDHSSGIGGDFDFPMGGVLVMSRGTNTATFDVILDSNYFDEITNASGGVGQFSLDMDGGQWNVIAEENTFDTPGNAPWFIRADNNGNSGTMNSNVLFQNNNYIRAFFNCPDPSCAGGYFGPGLRSLVDTQYGANLNFTLNNDELVHHDTGFDPGNTVEVRQLNVPAGGNNGTICANFVNNDAPDGYSVEKFHTVGTFNIEKGLSNSGPCANCTDAQIADVVNDNGNTGGGNNPATVPPVVNVFNTPDGGGAINIVTTACTLPSIPFALTETTRNFENHEGLFSPDYQTPAEMLALLKPFVKGTAKLHANSDEVVAEVSEETDSPENNFETATEVTQTNYLATTAASVREVWARIEGLISPTAYAQSARGEADGVTDVSVGPFTLPAGKTVTVKFRATVDNGPYPSGLDAATNTANMNANGGINMTSNTTSIPLDAAPDLVVTKSEGGATAQPGSVIAYTLSYSNQTAINGQDAANVVLTETVPANTTFNAGASSMGWGGAGCVDGAASGTVCSLTVGALGDNGSGTATFAVNLLSALPAGATQVSNTSSIAENPNVNGADRAPATNTAADTTLIVGNWDGSTSTDWNTASNWSNDILPPPMSSVSIPDVANAPAVTTADVSVVNLVLNGENLTIDAGRTLTASGTVVLGSNVIGGAGTLSLDAGGTISRTSGQVNATLAKTFGQTGAFIYPVGTTGQYSPVNVNVTTLGSLSVKANTGTVPSAPPVNPATTLQRYWSLNGTGGIVADLTFNYLQTDVAGNEANYKLMRVLGGAAVAFNNAPTCPASGSPCVNPAANTIFASGVSSFSDWLAGELAPTAANASVSGRVVTEGGRAIANAFVTITDPVSNLHRQTFSDRFGNFYFEEIPVGATYIVTTEHGRYLFQSPTQVVPVLDNVNGVTFVGTSP